MRERFWGWGKLIQINDTTKSVNGFPCCPTDRQDSPMTHRKIGRALSRRKGEAPASPFHNAGKPPADRTECQRPAVVINRDRFVNLQLVAIS